MDPRIERVLAVAAGELGVTEATGRNDGPRVTMYLNRLRTEPAADDPRKLDRGLAYCAAWVQWVWWMAGLGLPINFWECRRVATLHTTLEGLGAVLPAGSIPEPGDVLLWVGASAHDSAGPSGHTALVREAHASGREALIHTIGGNEKSRKSDPGGVRARERTEHLDRPTYTAVARPIVLFGGDS